MHRTVVDFPDPEGPMMTSFSPSLTSRFTSFNTCRSPKFLFTFSSLIVATVFPLSSSSGSLSRLSKSELPCFFHRSTHFCGFLKSPASASRFSSKAKGRHRLLYDVLVVSDDSIFISFGSMSHFLTFGPMRSCPFSDGLIVVICFCDFK